MSTAISATRRFFRIQYVSDLHLECYDKAVFPLLVKPAARYLALAGNIGQPAYKNFASFINYAATNWDKVFYVAGNNEYHSTCYNRWVEAHIQDIVGKHRNVHFLNSANPSHYITKENVAIVGNTLWPRIQDEPCASAYRMSATMSEQKMELARQIQYWAYQKIPVCVITHHIPSYALSRSKDYVSDCESLMRPPVHAWIYGRAAVCTGMINTVFTAVNARGYPNETVKNFSPTQCLEFSIDDDDGTDKPLQELTYSATLDL